MRYLRTTPFIKQYKKLSPIVQRKVDRQLIHLAQDIRHPALYAKKMSGVGDIWEARVNGRYRFTFQIDRDVVILRKVGTHDIYRKP